MYDFVFRPDDPKDEFYKELLSQIKAITTGERNWVTNLSNASALIFHGLNTLKFFQQKPVNWAGFYIRSSGVPALGKTDGYLTLGPFQGKVACTKIKIGKGVCGTAAAQRVTQVVGNVHEFPGHIACDSTSASEIVVPMIHPHTGDVLGVLDIDDTCTDAFDQEDKIGLEAVVKVLVEACDWTI